MVVKALGQHQSNVFHNLVISIVIVSTVQYETWNIGYFDKFGTAVGTSNCTDDRNVQPTNDISKFAFWYQFCTTTKL